MSNVVYGVSSGPAHAPYYLVMLRSLRRYYDGRIHIFAYPESYDVLSKIGADPKIQATVEKYEPIYKGKNGQFVNKIHCATKFAQKVDRALYLDADTLICDSVDPLFRECGDGEMLATQFNHWTCQQRSVQRRIARLVGIDEIPQTAIRMCLKSDQPSVNGGVFCADPACPALSNWYSWTMAAKHVFIADETVLHVLAYYFPAVVNVAKGGIWNASPKHKSDKHLKDADVKIWHFHGDCNVRPDKSRKGLDLWWPEFRDCYDRNLGNVRTWARDVGNSYLNALMDKGM